MHFSKLLSSSTLLLAGTYASSNSVDRQPIATNVHGRNVTYKGLFRSGTEGFVGIRFGKDTSGEKRLRAPIAFLPGSNTEFDATDYGLSCPQDNSEDLGISEDCLKLNVWRPMNTTRTSKLPVLVWIYGGSFRDGYKDDPETFSGGIISQSIANGYPIMHVAINYRLGVFGFARSKALEESGDENLGLRDQRLALEWIHDNIAAFGGDPDKITIHGQSSGGLSVGMHIMAYGADRPVPFRGAICESQAVQPAITGNVTRRAQERILEDVGCDDVDYDSEEAIDCLRKLPMNTLLKAQLSTADGSISANQGDEWLPVVDGTHENAFLPAAPSELVAQGRLANVSLIVGWMADDATEYTAQSLGPKDDARSFLRAYAPALSSANIHQALALHPAASFHNSYKPDGSIAIRAEVYRAAQIYRDILFTCSAVYVAEGLAKAGSPVYLFHENQTILTRSQHARGKYGYGAVHTSDLAYVFGNLSYYLDEDSDDGPYELTRADYELADRQSRSWSTFTAVGRPSADGHTTLQSWKMAQFENENLGACVIGGPTPGFSGSGSKSDASAREALKPDELYRRCQFWNSPEVIRQLQY